MEIDADSLTVAGGHGSMTVQLHPLVLMNISEHWTRNKVSGNPCDVYGALLGKQEGHHTEIINSFELLLDEPHLSVNVEFYNTRESQCKQVYPDLDIVGWYSTGGPISEKDELFNRQIQELTESLLILKLDPLQSTSEQLPVRIYESVVDNDGRIHFRQVVYTLATDEAERIGVDHVTRISMANNGQSSSITAEHLLGNYQAIQMLATRLYIIRAYVAAVASGELPVNRARLREISSLVKRLPLLASESASASDNRRTNSIGESFYRQANDVCFASLLASLTQGMHTLYGCMTKTAHVVDRRFMSVTSSSSMMAMNPSAGLGKVAMFVNNFN